LGPKDIEGILTGLFVSNPGPCGVKWRSLHGTIGHDFGKTKDALRVNSRTFKLKYNGFLVSGGFVLEA
jgi:hypothetical protein